MDIKEFKNKVNDSLKSIGFNKKGSYYYKRSDEVICVIGIQKSSYSNCYYINLGYILKDLRPDLEFPREVDGDIRTRFTFDANGKKVDCIDVEAIPNNEYLMKALEDNILQFVDSTLSLEGIKELLQKMPVLLYQTKMSAKKYLGIE